MSEMQNEIQLQIHAVPGKMTCGILCIQRELPPGWLLHNTIKHCEVPGVTNGVKCAQRIICHHLDAEYWSLMLGFATFESLCSLSSSWNSETIHSTVLPAFNIK